MNFRDIQTNNPAYPWKKRTYPYVNPSKIFNDELSMKY